MRIIILGAGRVGESVAETLVSEANDITVVDPDPERLRALEDRLDLRGVAGNGVQPSILRAAGTFTIRFNENGMQVEPTSASDAEAYVHCSFDNLLAMARGFVTVDKLYLSGQLRLSGNLSKGFEIRYLLSPAKQRA